MFEEVLMDLSSQLKHFLSAEEQVLKLEHLNHLERVLTDTRATLPGAPIQGVWDRA